MSGVEILPLRLPPPTAGREKLLRAARQIVLPKSFISCAGGAAQISVEAMRLMGNPLCIRIDTTAEGLLFLYPELYSGSTTHNIDKHNRIYLNVLRRHSRKGARTHWYAGVDQRGVATIDLFAPIRT